MTNAIPWLHLFSQGFEHDDGAIVGTRDALLALKAGIEQALVGDHGTGCVEAFVNDGEGYRLNIYRVSEVEMGRMARPYPTGTVDGSEQQPQLGRMRPEDLPFQPAAKASDAAAPR